jgi:hypothetical protein
MLQKVVFLEALCARNGLYWFLGRLTQSKKDDDYYDEDDEEPFSLKETVLPNRRKVALAIDSIEEADILADTDSLYEDRSADSEEEGEYTGNESMATTIRLRS